MSWELSAQVQAFGAQSDFGDQAGIIPMTPAGIYEYALHVHREARQAAHDLRIEIAKLKHRCKALERDLAALKAPVENNWSA